MPQAIQTAERKPIRVFLIDDQFAPLTEKIRGATPGHIQRSVAATTQVLVGAVTEQDFEEAEIRVLVVEPVQRLMQR